MDGFKRRREQKTQDILKAALSLFMKYGVKKVSISEIAKEANVSQVTIYNYFESKDKLIHEVLIYYVDDVWQEYEKLLNSDMDFPDKVKQIIFNKTDAASHLHEDFYHYFMKEYTQGIHYIEELYTNKVFPGLIDLFNEGREQGYINPNVSNKAILFYIQMLKEAMQKTEVNERILPMTEEIMHLLFYGIIGKGND
ncbi:TetR/AcrR family transcriptional regulator [Oceanobacillus salinisoli]|uniref:TetR/AcrR family transcriptional regulator n=1 Tax=Oceanobacillus salinisoli TaxID=2678611 RepID=UPI0012E222EA|nr:TetR/AcrR family transcriptional regulator [Oceanobacillus salinisoli]